ncbi:MAG TPA: hypothetical protein VGN63_09165 [Flavisolibacter sp.]|jgi:hypothetical protein|nr:hypothetical protein [Flavisolibacter sp.]
MKKENTSFFSNLFGAKGKSQTVQQTTSVVLTPSSQPHVLRQRMEEESLTHGKTVTANISPVRLDRSMQEEAVLYFCPMKKIEVLEITAAGDGGALPKEATVEGLSVPDEYRSGFYRLCNVVLSSNGTMQVKATAQTKWERIEA